MNICMFKNLHLGLGKQQQLDSDDLVVGFSINFKHQWQLHLPNATAWSGMLLLLPTGPCDDGDPSVSGLHCSASLSPWVTSFFPFFPWLDIRQEQRKVRAELTSLPSWISFLSSWGGPAGLGERSKSAVGWSDHPICCC